MTMASRVNRATGKSGLGLDRRDWVHLSCVLFSVAAFVLVQLEVPDPYLDEIFHIPQTQRYCAEDFEYWDEAITTPPGLYLLSAIPLMTVHIPCTPPTLRFTNLLFSICLIPGILSSILSLLALTGREGRSKAFWRHLLKPSSEALVISAFPLVFFFGNLYYTDVASLAGVLGVYLLALKGRHWSAALVGCWSMTVRQTNVIWIAFILATCLLRLAREEELKSGKEDGADVADPNLGDIGITSIVMAVVGTARALLRIPGKTLRTAIPYMVPFGGFVAFLKWNGGIVLGHKENHQPVLHVPQLLYFIAFASVLLFPVLLGEGVFPSIRGSLSTGLSSSTRIAFSLLTLLGMLLAVHRFTIFHPFLLADNRHYVFYLVRWVLKPYPVVKYALAPVYLVLLWAWIWRLRHRATLLWSVGFMACTAIVLIPTPLIEPRYFLIPTILLRLQLAAPAARSEAKTEYSVHSQLAASERGQVVEYIWYTLINTATIALFLTRKFRWEGWEGWMRFMW